MRGTKRFAASKSVQDGNDTVLNNKRILAGSLFDVHRAEPSQQQSLVAPVLDVQRAELSRQHVRALNTQFASWVQMQLTNHPDELWEDGVRDYLAHASNIMNEFSDIVSWLKANTAKANTAKAGTLTASESLISGKKLVAETTNKETTIVKEKSGYTPVSSNASFTASWSSGVFSSSQSSGTSSNSQSAGSFSYSQSSGLFSNSKSSGLFPNSQSFGLFSNNQTSEGFSNGLSSGLLSNGQSSGGLSYTQSTGLFSNSQSSELFSNNQSFGFSSSNNNQSSETFPSTQSSGLFSFSQSSGVFSNNGGTSSVPVNTNASIDGEDENDLQRPSSPSVKKAEEKGIIVVHEVKCKLYVKSSDPTDKDTWKDKGTGQLSIKCKEGVSKGTKESNPTILVRNDVGKLLLNALLYSGIKTRLQKNSLVAIFHTLDDNGGNDNVVARTFLIRTKTEEDTNKLATAIQEYAPAS
ncbi:uncharacterized protein LOC119986551 [Tripterygium wilfordii]|uniref:uncharacterized protein LOC119986551 n=1 Tax=Tripterygium wilfordii TaxID=458696 RepID=UPI0018F85A42|nr:uncharacterized protein LOC119986551 [Tripterygium wilfordii]